MLTTVWGPSLWHTLHTISFNYPLKPTKRDKINYKRFIYQLRHVLPCKHYVVVQKSAPMQLSAIKTTNHQSIGAKCSLHNHPTLPDLDPTQKNGASPHHPPLHPCGFSVFSKHAMHLGWKFQLATSWLGAKNFRSYQYDLKLPVVSSSTGFFKIEYSSKIWIFQ